MLRPVLWVTLALFGALTVMALRAHGVVGLFTDHLKTWGGAQIFADLVIALVLVLSWMWRDAKATGRNIWPWLVATLALGSFGPLVYLLTRRSEPATH